MRKNNEVKNDVVMKLKDETLTITKRDTFDIDIEALTDVYEQLMIDDLYNSLTGNLDLDADTADYIVDDNTTVRDTILNLVKAEMFKRMSAKSLTVITKA